ncbi:hypothetical protein BCR33DRAFT_678118 [Rhizoclosmatium globosum]|uniref:Uncharacterized protein n=1 Tax=Rhizoclosmatium globosum TaxID=329046 RepID=A0A1Y2CJS9_9FUNG|nr:hypothetical protein BCR33DRAFT_678118 [Rhizoclosmatium globosum]|eukprot:ORY47260.1 hypothetical protein BCR33DRAFT_678118 [Rhizoclosmatium globosum]
MGKVSKGSKAAADGPPKEQFQLKYLRFSCNDLARTKEFYVTLGMSVEWQLRSSKTPLNTQTPATPNVPPTADATKDPEKRRPSLVQKIQQISANKKAAQDAAAKKAADELAGILTAAPVEEVKPQPQPEPPAGSPNVFKTDLCMSFSITPSNSTEHPDPTQFQLIFSNISTHKPSSQSNSRTNSRVNSRNNSAINRSINFNFGVEDKKENKKKERNQEYLVIYVHLLPRLVKRLAQKGFVCSLPITPFQGAQIAILQDPNGIEVRLIELTEAQSEDPNVLVKRQWFARVGYYTIPSVKLDHTSRYYERMFSYIGAPVAPAAGPGGIPAPPVKKEKKKKGMAAEAGTHANTAGVRLIDSEEYVVGLTKTQFLWFGNEPRSVGTSICFTGKVIAESQEARQMDRSDSLLMGIGKFILAQTNETD